MLNYAALFMIITLTAALLEFSGIAAGVAGMAQVPFSLFLALFLASLVMGWRRRPLQ